MQHDLRILAKKLDAWASVGYIVPTPAKAGFQLQTKLYGTIT